MAEPCPGPPSAPSAPQCSQFPPPSAPSASQWSQFPPPRALQCSQFPPPSAPQCSHLPPPTLEGLIPPSHFVLRPRSLGVELEAERGRGHELEVELKALKGRSQHLEAKLEAERRRSQQLEAELEAEKGRSQSLEVELKSERGRSQALGVELDALRGRGQRLEAELDAEKGRSQILEMELETLRRRGLGPEEVEQSPEQVLLGRWRQKVFQLLLQVRLQQGQELQLQGQVRSLGAAVAAGSRQVSLLELRLRQGEQERQALSQERLRAEAAEEELGKLGQALSRLLGTLGMALADVTVAVGALGTLSERLGRAQHRLRGGVGDTLGDTGETVGTLGTLWGHCGGRVCCPCPSVPSVPSAGGLRAAPVAAGAGGDSRGQQHGGPRGDIGAGEGVAPREYWGWLCPQGVTLMSPPGHQRWGWNSATPRHSVPGPVGDASPGPWCRHPWGHRGPRSARTPMGTQVTSSGTQGTSSGNGDTAGTEMMSLWWWW
ncbi:uncharacterized protein LOC132340522 [Haemorhous mexicanus]|uniref:uncharacterized protein LOC132340522 n=1 Tax=Haemorhous mexicanus TaxID=30427 RepID=UPI0028BDDB1E|nr:uncharacterized protein LOC132340522 [Haemorhous mexicanus]